MMNFINKYKTAFIVVGAGLLAGLSKFSEVKEDEAEEERLKSIEDRLDSLENEEAQASSFCILRKEINDEEI